MINYNDLTPTDQLVLELLAARWRVGDDECWTFDSRLNPQLRKLEGLGLLWWKHGIVEKTSLAGLETAGKDMVLSPRYHGKGRRYERPETA